MITAVEEDVVFSTKKRRIYHPSKSMETKQQKDPRRDQTEKNTVFLTSAM